MLNPIDEMRRLSSLPYEDLLHAAIANYGLCPNGKRFSKVEIITYIVAITTVRSQYADMITHQKEATNNRTRYRFREMDGTEHYVMLTPEQERFMRWNSDNAIDYDNIDIDVIGDIDWETP